MLPTTELDLSHNGPRSVLLEHHRQIEAACEALRSAVYTDDPSNVIARYRSFEHAVLEHLSSEEEAILPAYAQAAPADAELLLATHDELRRQLFRIGVDVELHAVRAVTLETLIAALREHAAYEDRRMYPWAEAHLPLPTRRELFKRLVRSLRNLAPDTEHVAPPRQHPVAE